MKLLTAVSLSLAIAALGNNAGARSINDVYRAPFKRQNVSIEGLTDAAVQDLCQHTEPS